MAPRRYVVAELILDVPHATAFTAQYPYFSCVLPYRGEVHQAILDASDGAVHCGACEGGYSRPKTAESHRANRAIAAQRGLACYDAQPLRDLRFWRTEPTWRLLMRDAMPWTTDELDAVVAAMRANGVGVVVEVKGQFPPG